MHESSLSTIEEHLFNPFAPGETCLRLNSNISLLLHSKSTQQNRRVLDGALTINGSLQGVELQPERDVEVAVLTPPLKDEATGLFFTFTTFTDPHEDGETSSVSFGVSILPSQLNAKPINYSILQFLQPKGDLSSCTNSIVVAPEDFPHSCLEDMSDAVISTEADLLKPFMIRPDGSIAATASLLENVLTTIQGGEDILAAQEELTEILNLSDLLGRIWVQFGSNTPRHTDIPTIASSDVSALIPKMPDRIHEYVADRQTELRHHLTADYSKYLYVKSMPRNYDRDRSHLKDRFEEVDAKLKRACEESGIKYEHLDIAWRIGEVAIALGANELLDFYQFKVPESAIDITPHELVIVESIRAQASLDEQGRKKKVKTQALRISKPFDPASTEPETHILPDYFLDQAIGRSALLSNTDVPGLPPEVVDLCYELIGQHIPLSTRRGETTLESSPFLFKVAQELIQTGQINAAEELLKEVAPQEAALLIGSFLDQALDPLNSNLTPEKRVSLIVDTLTELLKTARQTAIPKRFQLQLGRIDLSPYTCWIPYGCSILEGAQSVTVDINAPGAQVLKDSISPRYCIVEDCFDAFGGAQNAYRCTSIYAEQSAFSFAHSPQGSVSAYSRKAFYRSYEPINCAAFIGGKNTDEQPFHQSSFVRLGANWNFAPAGTELTVTAFNKERPAVIKKRGNASSGRRNFFVENQLKLRSGVKRYTEYPELHAYVEARMQRDALRPK